MGSSGSDYEVARPKRKRNSTNSRALWGVPSLTNGPGGSDTQLVSVVFVPSLLVKVMTLSELLCTTVMSFLAVSAVLAPAAAVLCAPAGRDGKWSFIDPSVL